MEDNNSNYPRFISNKPCGEDKYEGKSQERLVNAIVNHILSIDKNFIDKKSKQKPSRIIGLKGAWGAGKSNVIKQLEQHKDIKNKYYVFEFDAWGHQEDLQRRSFLETLTKNLIDKNHFNKLWKQRLEDLLAHKIVRINKTLPKFDAGAFWTALFLALTPITVFVAERLENASIINCIWILVLIAFAPILFGVLLWLFLMLFHKEMRNIGWILQISKNETIKTKNTETINEKEPTVSDFKNWMLDISDDLKKNNKKLIIVYDNMDRLPADKVKELWSSINTFFSEGGFDNIWTMIPFDEKHLSCAFGESKEKEKLVKYFISKTFPVVYRVTPPVITDFKDIFNKLYREAFADTETKHKEEINRIFRLEKPDATVRDIIEFINQLVALKNIWHDEIESLYLAIFILKEEELFSCSKIEKHKTINDSSNTVEQILSGEYLGNYIPKIVKNDETLQTNISALVYGVSLDRAEQIPMSKYIESCFNMEPNTDINKYSASSNFIFILEDKVNTADIVKISNIINSLSTLNFSNFSENDKNTVTLLWKYLAEKRKKLPLEKQEFNLDYKNLLLNTNKSIQEDILKYLCKQIQLFDPSKFSGKDYYDSLYQIKTFIEKNKIEFDIEANLSNKEVDSKSFMDFIIEAKENYKLFRLTTNQNKLNDFIITFYPIYDVWKQNLQQKNQKFVVEYTHASIKDVLTFLIKDSSFKLDNFLNNIKERLPEATAENFKQYFDIYKILSDEKPFEVQLNPSQQQDIWNSLSSKSETSEYLEILTIQFAYGFNLVRDIDDKRIIYIAENLDYYVNFGDILIKNLSLNIPVLKKVLKYMIENKLGQNLNLEKVLPYFFNIKSQLKISETAFIDQLNDWEKDKESITSKNIKSVIADAKFFVFSKKIKNALTDYLNKTVIEALSIIQIDQLKQSQQDDYWMFVIKNFIDTDFLEILPDNLTELGKKYLDEIAASRLEIPRENNIVYKLIEKLDPRKTIAQIKDIRDKFCNSQYVMNPNLFLYFENRFEKQGNLKQVADRVTHKIIEPVINDNGCFDKIIKNSNYYASIINAAGDDATSLKEIIKNRIKDSTDENLISFAKKIGIEFTEEEKKINEDKRN